LKMKPFLERPTVTEIQKRAQASAEADRKAAVPEF